MSVWEIWLLAVGLAMDCFAVSVVSGITLKRVRWMPMLFMALMFGLFQAGMPLVSWIGASLITPSMERVGHVVAVLMLLFLGGHMIWESLKEEEEEHEQDPTKLWVVLLLAVATSIDALTVGVSFACLGYYTWAQILPPVGIIGWVSFLFSTVGLLLGIGFGRAAQRFKAELWGGVILILIGVKIALEQLSN